MNTEELTRVTPSARQLEYQQTEFYAFAHFTVNTFTDREWGDGKESESVFNPTALDADQWVAAVKSAGMRGLILTAKHHDGFCLWPSEYTEHCVKNSPWKDGKGDVVREVSDACRRGNIKFGVYLSPWDRNSALYGDSERYNDYYVAQLTELLTGYGDIFSVWFDGACGEGPNGKRQMYDWGRYYRTIRELQPNACIAICGPDIRWCGNEAGSCRASEWSVVPSSISSNENVIKASQSSPEDAERLNKIDSMSEDLGSREIMKLASGAVWFPAEVDTSIRPGWFYHAAEDDRVRSLDTLTDIYYNSVGGNAMLLLNIPPDRRGLFHENDVARLAELGERLRADTAVNTASNARFESDDSDGENPASGAQEDGYDSFFATPEGRESAEITITPEKPTDIHMAVLKENIKMSQRIERFEIDVLTGGEWKTVYSGTTVGYKKMARFESVRAEAIRLRVLESRGRVTLSFIGIY